MKNRSSQWTCDDITTNENNKTILETVTDGAIVTMEDEVFVAGQLTLYRNSWTFKMVSFVIIFLVVIIYCIDDLLLCCIACMCGLINNHQ